MRFTNLIIIFLASMLVWQGCKKDSQNTFQPAYHGPAMEAKSAAVYPDGGVTLTGTIHKIPDSLASYGFMLATDSLMQSNVLFVKAAAPVALGDFKVDVNTGILTGKKYYYSPFYSIYNAPTGPFGSYAMYAKFNVKSFNSDGSKSVRVDSVYPLKAVIGDTITVKGKYFSMQGLNVIIGNQFGFLSLSDTIIKFIVPTTITSTTPVITLQYGTKNDTIGKGFSLYAPVINSFTSTASFRDTITINGDHLGYLTSLNEVDFGAAKGTVVSASRKQIKVVVPDNIVTINSALTVKAQLQFVNAGTPFHIRRPVITSVTNSAATGSTITIAGKYFDPIISNNKLYFENIGAQTNSGSSTQLTATLPPGPFPRRKAAVKLQFLDTTITYSPDILLTDKWIMASNSMPFAASLAKGAFTINNISYVVAPANAAPGQVNYLWKFNPANYTWQQITLPFSFYNGAVAATSSKAYLYTVDLSANFWEYDPASNTWTQKANHPISNRYVGTMFVIGSKVYLGCGITPPSNPENSFYEYDITTNIWSQKASYPASPSIIAMENGSALVLNNKAYVFGSANIQNYDNTFVYDPSTDSWTPKASFNSNNNGKNLFVYNGYGYIAGMLSYSFQTSNYRSCYKYDGNADTWTMLPYNIGQVAVLGSFNPGFLFINNGNIYTGTGDGTTASQLYTISTGNL